MDHQGLAHLLPPPTTEVTTLRPYHHLTRLSAPLLLALLLTVVTEKQIKLKQSLLCSWPSNGSHVSQNQIPYKGLTSSTCPFHISNHFLHSFKHGSSHGSLGLSWPPDTSLPQSLCYCSYSTTCTCVPHCSPISMLHPFTHTHTHTHTHTPLCFPGLFAPLTLTTFFFFFNIFHYCLSPLTSKFTPRSKENLFCSSPAPRTVCHT